MKTVTHKFKLYRKCNRCDEVKALGEFTPNKGSRFGRHTYCRVCMAQRTSEWEQVYATPEYVSWKSMIRRCTSPKSTGYKYWGGRGITVCNAWRNSFTQFLADMGPRPEGTSLDRIDPYGNYEPSNCRWADWKTQAANRRPRQKKTA